MAHSLHFLHSLHIPSRNRRCSSTTSLETTESLLVDFAWRAVHNAAFVYAWHFRHFLDHRVKCLLDSRRICKLIGDEPIGRESVLVEGEVTLESVFQIQSWQLGA